MLANKGLVLEFAAAAPTAGARQQKQCCTAGATCLAAASAFVFSAVLLWLVCRSCITKWHFVGHFSQDSNGKVAES
jgi:hypothetical protein